MVEILGGKRGPLLRCPYCDSLTRLARDEAWSFAGCLHLMHAFCRFSEGVPDGCWAEWGNDLRPILKLIPASMNRTPAELIEAVDEFLFDCEYGDRQMTTDTFGDFEIRRERLLPDMNWHQEQLEFEGTAWFAKDPQRFADALAASLP